MVSNLEGGFTLHKREEGIIQDSTCGWWFWIIQEEEIVIDEWSICYCGAINDDPCKCLEGDPDA